MKSGLVVFRTGGRVGFVALLVVNVVVFETVGTTGFVVVFSTLEGVVFKTGIEVVTLWVVEMKGVVLSSLGVRQVDFSQTGQL